MKKFLFLICACFVLAIPCFANDVYSFSESLSVNCSNYPLLNWNFSSSDDGVYFYGIRASNGSDIIILGITDNINNHFSLSGTDESGNSISQSFSFSSVGATDGFYFKTAKTYYTNLYGSVTFTPNITIFPYNTSNSEIVSALQDYINNPTVPNVDVSFTLPRGNVLYFKVAENQDVHFESDFMANSALFSSGTYGPWGDTQQRFGAVSALPTSSTVFPLSSQNPITWYKSPNQNVLGQTKTGRASMSCVTNQYYCFYNPAFSYVSDTQERDSVGGTVLVNGSFAEIKIYPLSQQLTIENGQVLMNSDSNDGYSSYFDGTSNENGTVTFTDQDGNIGLPVNGGQNQQDAPITAQGLIESIKGTLQNILREIESLFTFGYEAIQNLVGTISEFTSVFSQLYTWLPSPVYQALISAIIIAITIGVFKVFL